MKELVNNCQQKHAYGDSYGECVVELEGDETIEYVVKKYVSPCRHWFEQRYSNAREGTEYIRKNSSGEVIATYTGKLVIMNTQRAYLD